MWIASLTAQEAPSALISGLETPASVVSMPVRIDLDPIFQKVEQLAPRTPPGVETWTALPTTAKGAAAYRFNMYRDPLFLRLTNNRVLVRTQAHYWLEVGLKAGSLVTPMGSCGKGKEGFRRVWLSATADIGLTPQWGLQVKVEARPPEAATPCEITFLDVDITPKVLGGMNDAILKAAGSLEKMLNESVILRQQAENLWNQVQQPLALAPGIHLLIRPERLKLGAWTSAKRILTIPLEVQARPTLVLGEPPKEALRPLPVLESQASPITPGFRVSVEADLPFDEATKQFRQQLSGKKFDTEKGSFEVLDITVGGRQGKALLTLQLKGKIDGTLQLTGRPRFDEATGTLRLDDLEYTLESRSWITKFGEWLFRSSLKKVLQEKANWFLDRSFKDLKGMVNQGLNRTLAPGLELKGNLEELSLQQPKVLEDRFRVEASLNGAVEVAFRGGL